MKTNKFRAWEIKEKKMWFNVQNAYDTLSIHCCEQGEEDTCNCVHVDFSPCCFGNVVDEREDESEEYIVMQYIGRKDSTNENELYEDDLIEDPQGNIGKIFYSEESCAYLVNWKRKDGSYETDSCIGYGRLVGNIHNNPELFSEVKL